MAVASAGPRRRSVAGLIARKARTNPDDPALPGLRRELDAERLADHIRQVVDAWPPLSQSQREHLAMILLTPAAARAASGDSTA